MIYSYKKKQNKENIIQVAPNLSPAFQPLVYYQAIISILFDQRVLLDVQLPTLGYRSRCCFHALNVGEMNQALDVLYGFFRLPASRWWSELKMEIYLYKWMPTLRYASSSYLWLWTFLSNYRNIINIEPRGPRKGALWVECLWLNDHPIPPKQSINKNTNKITKAKLNKTIEDGGITVDFWIIKVHTSN